jgi:hypothetical protein
MRFVIIQFIILYRWVEIHIYEPKTMLNSHEIVNFFTYVFLDILKLC